MKRKSVRHKGARVPNLEQEKQRTPIAPESSEALPMAPPVALLPPNASQPSRLGPNESSTGDNAFDSNAPYGANIPAVDENIFSSRVVKRIQHIVEELNLARSIQASTRVPLHDAVKIALRTLLGVSNLLSSIFSSLIFIKITF